MQYLKDIVTLLKNVGLGAIAIWQLVQVGGFLDPFRGWKSGLPQLIAALIVIVTYLLMVVLLKRIPEYKFKEWHLIGSLVSLIAFLFLSLNIVLGLGSGAVLALSFVAVVPPISVFWKGISRHRPKWWPMVVSGVLLVVVVVVWCYIILGSFSGEDVVEARRTEQRLQLTLVFYSAFAMNFALVIALLSRVKSRD